MRRALAILLLCAPTLAAQDKDFGAAPASQGALARDPRALPRGAAGAWSDWNPQSAIPPDVASPLGEAMRAYGAAQYGPALERLLSILERQPDYPPALYQAGLCYFRLKRYRDCAVLVERFAEVAPSESGATQVLGHCYYSLGDYEKALAQYQKVLAAVPKSVEALRGLALTRMRLGDSEAALALLHQVVELRPTHADAWIWIGQIEDELGRAEPALAAVQRAKELDQFEPRAWFLESRILLELGREADAQRSRERFDLLSRVSQEIRQIQGILAQDPSRVDALLRWIELEHSIKNAPVLRELLPRLVQARPYDVDTRILVLDVYTDVGDAEGAAQAAGELERRAGSEARAWQRLEQYYASVRDRVRQAQAGERYRRLKGDGKE